MRNAADCEVLYLHGFSSSPGSKKGVFLRERLAARRVALSVPDLNRPSYEALTLTAQVEEVHRFLTDLASPHPALLIGSSMGALVSVLYAAAHPERVERMLLVAPAFKFVGSRLAAAAGSDLETWETQGWLPMSHYADDRIHRVGFQLVEDARRYDFDALTVPLPLRVIHGTADELIPIDATRRWVHRHPGVELVEVEGGSHDLGDHYDEVWEAAEGFLFPAEKDGGDYSSVSPP